MTDQRRVMIVTDSTSDLPDILRTRHDITVVPLTVVFGEESFRDRVDITPETFLDRLTHAPQLPTTSQPPAHTFSAVFADALSRDMNVVCITISSALSGTFNAARLAAEEFGQDRIRVIDSRCATMQLGWVAVAAARAAESGADLDAVERAALDAIPHTRLFAVLQTLDYLYKGGRIGRAQHMVGSALGIKPVLSVIDGIVTPVERVRTWKKALAQAIDLASGDGPLTDIAVLHAGNLPDAERTAAALQERFPQANIVIDWAGTTILTYAGPGAIGIMTLAADS
ncbi:MAG TPA: DegV family protein [Thermomicrobiales bacterium]|nr:DegV family protein [Thermomicrobiales bacterium]